MTLPICVQTWDALAARYPAAVETVWQAWDARAMQIDRPGQIRRHVFDCPSGLRLIVSRDVIEEGGPALLHVSAWANERAATAGCATGKEIGWAVKETFARISGRRLAFAWPPTFCGTPAYVPHWYFSDDETN